MNGSFRPGRKPGSGLPKPKRDGIAEILKSGRMPGFVTNTPYRYSQGIPFGLRTPAQAEQMEREGERQFAEAKKAEHEQRRQGGKRGMHHKGQMTFDEFAVATREFGRGWQRDKKTRSEVLKKTGRAF